MDSNARPHEKSLASQRGDYRHAKLIDCGASSLIGAPERETPTQSEFERVLNLFPSECDEPMAARVGSERDRRINNTRRRVAEHFLTEDSIFTIVPAGPAVQDPKSFTRRRRPGSRPRLRLAASVRSLKTRIAHAFCGLGRLIVSMAWTAATRSRLLAVEVVVAVAAGIVTTVGGITLAVREAERIAIGTGHRIQSAMVSLCGVVDRVARRGIRRTSQSAHSVTRAATRHAIDTTRRARVAMTSFEAHIQHVRSRAGRLLNRAERAFISRGGLVLSQKLRVRMPSLGVRGQAALRRSFVATTVATVLGVAGAAIGTFELRDGRRLAASSIVARPTIFATLRAPVQPSSVGEPRTPIAALREARTSVVPARVPVAATAEIQRVLNRYRDAFSILDDRAVQGVWPSVDIHRLRTDFSRVYEQNLDYESCDITIREADAGAVCRGIVRSISSPPHTTRRENREWRFALRKVNDRWLIAAVDVSSLVGGVGATASRGAARTFPHAWILVPGGGRI
jgi:hypothetical protein